MAYNVVFTRTADKHLKGAVEWYNNQKDLLGLSFREEVSVCIEKILDDRIDFQLYFRNIRKIKTARFPFVIYFIKETEQHEILIVSILHARRNPAEIRALLK